MINNKKWLYGILIIVFIGLSSIVTFNYYVNPYGVFSHDKKDIEKTKNYSVNSEMTKFYYALEKEPSILMVGTSRMEHIHPKYLKPYVNGNIYNIGIKGSGIKTHSNIIRYFVKEKNVKTIILGLDFFTFNPVNITKDMNILKNRYSNYFYYDYKDSLLSVRTFRKSISTLKDNIKNKPSFINMHNGWESYKDDYINLKNLGEEWLDKKINSAFPNFGIDKRFFDNTSFQNPISINEGLGILKNIIDYCNENNVQLKIFTTPIYHKVYDVIKERGYINTYTYWKDSLRKYNTIYDFNYKNSITNDFRWYIDASHFQSRLGELIFARVYDEDLNTLPKDFGRILKEVD